MPTLRIKEGLLDKLQERSGIKAEDAFARSLNVTTQTLRRVKAGAPVGAGLVATIQTTYGLERLDEIAYVDTGQPAKAAA